MAARVGATPEFALAERIVAYAALPDELPVFDLVEAALVAGKPLLWPRVTLEGAIEVARAAHAELERDAAGWLTAPRAAPAEPLTRADLVIVPGVAFTRRGARLGRGGGHYDRLLASSQATSVGVAFDIQLADQLPTEPHDRGVDLVATPSGLWRKVE